MRTSSVVVAAVISVTAASRAAADTVALPHTEVTIEVEGWAAAEGDEQLGIDRVTDPAGRLAEIVSRFGSCATLVRAFGLTVVDQPPPPDYALFGTDGDFVYVCLELANRSLLVSARIDDDPTELEALLEAVAAAARAAKGEPEVVTAAISLPGDSDHSLDLEAGAWKRDRDEVAGVRVLELRPGSVGWSVTITQPLETCVYSSTPEGYVREQPSWLPAGASTALIMAREAAWRAEICIERPGFRRIIAIAGFGPPAEAEIRAVLDEIVAALQLPDAITFDDPTPGPERRARPPMLVHGLGGVLVASSRGTAAGAERGSGVLLAAEVSGQEERTLGFAFDGGVDLGYTYGGLAAELRAALGGGVRVGPVGVSVLAGGLLSLLGAASDEVGGFTRHAGGLLQARVTIRRDHSARTGLTAAVTQTAGANADQRRLDVGLTTRSVGVSVRLIEHAQLGEAAVARTVMVGIGVGF